MAYYIGIRYGSISVYSSTYMTANSRGTYSINSYFTKLDATWNYNNVLYDVYTYTSTDIDSLLRNLSCFIHNGGSGIIEKRQLSDGAEYVEQYTTATYPGHNSYVSGEIYLFGARKKQTVRNDKWCYTYTEKYDTNVGSSGSSARMYVNTKKTPSSIDTIDMGMKGSGGTRIIEFYNTSAVSGISVGLARSDTATSLEGSDQYNYAVFQRSPSGWSKTPQWGSDGRQVIAVHNTYYNGSSVTPLYAFYKGSTSSSVPSGNRTEYGYSSGSSTSWASRTGGDECIYLSICPTGSTKSYSTSFSVTANKRYDFSIHLRGRTNCGIVLSATSLSSPNLSSSGFYRKACSETDVYYTTNYTPTSNGSVYVYFVCGASNRTPYPFADIMVTPHCSITLNSNGGSGGLSGTSCLPDSNPSKLSSLPSRSGFTFMGYYTTQSSGGTQYFDASGTATRTVSGDITLYARWKNEVIYNPSNVNAYCTSDVSAATSTVSSQICNVSNIAWSCGSGATPTYRGISQISRPNGIVSSTGWELSDKGRKLTIPSGIQNGEYDVYFGLTSPGGSNYISNGGNGFNIHVSIISTTLTYGPVELIQHTPDDIIEGNITQQKRFPAGSFTISPSTIGDYFSPNGVFRQVVSCNNGRVREGNLIVNGWTRTPGFSDIVVPSLGTTISDEYTYTFASSNGNALVFDVRGERGQIFRKYILSGVREANSVTSLSASVGESSIYAGDKTFIKTKALFTSGDKVSVRGTYSGYDSSIINVDNNVTVIYVENISDEDDFALEYKKIYYYYGQYNDNFLFKKMWEDGPGSELTAEYIVTDTNDFDVLLHASYEYNGYFPTPTHIVGRLNEDMSDYGYVEEVRIIDVY